MNPKDKPRRRGRPVTENKKAVNFRLSEKAVAALDAIKNRTLWTKTLCVEKALLFANTNPEFRP